MSIINQIAPFKEVCVKNWTEEWFDGEVAESIKARDKLFKKFKKSKLLIDKELLNAARNSTHSLIYKNKKLFFKENIGKPKELWKSLTPLDYHPKISLDPKSVLMKMKLNFEPKVNANIFKNFFSNLADYLLKINSIWIPLGRIM